MLVTGVIGLLFERIIIRPRMVNTSKQIPDHHGRHDRGRTIIDDDLGR